MDVLYYFDLLFMDWLDLYNGSQFIIGVILFIDAVLLLLIFIMLEKGYTSKLSSITAVLVIINAPALYDGLGFIGVFIIIASLIFTMHKLVSYLSFVVLNSHNIPSSENTVSKSVFFSLTGRKKAEGFRKQQQEVKPLNEATVKQGAEYEGEEFQLGLEEEKPAPVRKRRKVIYEDELDG